MHTLRKVISAFAPSDAPLLLVGETGTGKRRIAEYVHRRSRYRRGPFIVVDCATLSEDRLALKLFRCGHSRCACWLPGVQDVGRPGTVLFAHVERLPPWALRRLQWMLDRRWTDYEELETTPMMRLMATLTEGADGPSPHDLQKQRLLNHLMNSWVPLVVPPLRERRSDIALLAGYCLAQANDECGKAVLGFTDTASAALETHSWPDNLHELVDRIGSAVRVAGDLIGCRHLAFQTARPKNRLAG